MSDNLSTKSPWDDITPAQAITQLFRSGKLSPPRRLDQDANLHDLATNLDMRAQLMAADIPLNVRLSPDVSFNDDLPDLTADLEGDESLLADTSLASVQSPSESKMLSLYATVKVTDIPWDITVEECVAFLGDERLGLAIYSAAYSPMHFAFDRMSGKTQSELYMEFESRAVAQAFVTRSNGHLLGNRAVKVEFVSSKEMLQAVFPRAAGKVWITQEELTSIINHVRIAKSPFVRKCPQRPVENFISVLALFPWANPEAFHPQQSQMIYAAFREMAAVLQSQFNTFPKLYPGHEVLLKRLVLSGTKLTDFSPDQKHLVCASTGIFPDAPLGAVNRGDLYRRPGLSTVSAGSVQATAKVFVPPGPGESRVERSNSAQHDRDWRNNARRNGITVSGPKHN